MELFEALRTRRSLAQLKPDPVPRETVEKILEAAIWAPNHKKLEPWKFFVFEKDGRQKLAGALIENYRTDHPDADDDEMAGPGTKSAKRVLAAPITIVITADRHEDEILDLENYAAACCATEHILLAAHALGLGTYWRTGEGCYTKPNAIKVLLEVPAETHLVGVVHLGYPEVSEKPSQRVPASEKTVWFSN